MLIKILVADDDSVFRELVCDIGGFGVGVRLIIKKDQDLRKI